jgi:F-type H+-transporting ATPase subunit delta
MLSRRVAKRYANALFEAAMEKKALEKVVKELGQFSDLYVNSVELQQVLDNPSIANDTKMTVIRDIAQKLGITDLVQNLLAVMLESNRLKHLPVIYDEIDKAQDSALGRLKIEATSAVALTALHKTRLTNALTKLLGKKIILTTEVDPSTIGGMKIRIGSIILDGTVQGRIERLERHLLSEQ